MATTQNVKIRFFQRKLYVLSKQNEDRRFYSLYDKVYRRDILFEAYFQCRANRGKPGIDGVTFKDIEQQGLAAWIEGVSRMLQNRTYLPKPVKRVYIPKPDGGQRPLGIPTICDRVVQTAYKIVTEPIFEAQFSDSSYGYRPRRSAADAVRMIDQSIKQGFAHVLDADLKGYLDTSSYCTPFHGKVLKRLICLSNTLIYKPICFPLRTWTAGSLPDFTRCNTV